MNRRDWLKTAGAATAGAFLPVLDVQAQTAGRAAARQAAGTGRLETEIVRLNLRHTWTTTMSSSEYRDVIYARFTRGGVTGVGEGAPIVRYKEDAKSAQAMLEKVRELVESGDPRHFDKLMARVFKQVPGEHAGKAALDIALLDWAAKSMSVPLYRLFGLDPADAAVTTMSVGVDTPEMTRQKVEEAADFPVLKIKMGIGKDDATLQAIRAVTNKPLRVDANEGWKTKEEAVEKINWLEKHGVQFVEQPLRADMIEETKWVRSRVHLPIIADEACTDATMIPRLAEAYDGLNVKLDKAGGVLEAYRWISIARALGMKTMLGCMVSSSVSVTAAAHLSPLVDYADLDGNLLVANDPYVGVKVQKGKLLLPTAPGLGVRKRT
jgi:L-alanine-DL-glutamate epimerase-like enolase superfamily enzyme